MLISFHYNTKGREYIYSKFSNKKICMANLLPHQVMQSTNSLAIAIAIALAIAIAIAVAVAIEYSNNLIGDTLTRLSSHVLDSSHVTLTLASRIVRF